MLVSIALLILVLAPGLRAYDGSPGTFGVRTLAAARELAREQTASIDVPLVKLEAVSINDLEQAHVVKGLTLVAWLLETGEPTSFAGSVAEARWAWSPRCRRSSPAMPPPSTSGGARRSAPNAERPAWLESPPRPARRPGTPSSLPPGAVPPSQPRG